MKLFFPLSGSREILPLINEGVDEFYFGFVGKANIDSFNSMNKRDFKKANFSDMSEVAYCIEVANKHGIPMNVTYNNHFYSDSQIDVILRELIEMRVNGLKGVVVADVALMKLIVQEYPSLKLIVSTGANVFNKDTVLFYKSLGVHRITIPRHVHFEDIRKIVTCSDLEYECFIFGEDCPYIQGLCSFLHNIGEKSIPNSHLCECEYSFKLLSQRPVPEQILKRIASNLVLMSTPYECGLCNLNDLEEMGISHTKITARDQSLNEKMQKLKLFNLCRNIKSKAGIKEAFRRVRNSDCQEHCMYLNSTWKR